jgi:hypothetical protein
MSNLIIDYAVDITRETAVTAASGAYLRRLGLFATQGVNFPQVDAVEFWTINGDTLLLNGDTVISTTTGTINDPSITVVKCTKYNEPDTGGNFSSNDAKLYTDDLGVESVITALGEVYLLFTRVASEVKSAADSEFYTISHTAESARETAQCVAIGEACATVNAVVVVSDYLEAQSGGVVATLENGKCVFNTYAYDPLFSDAKYYSTDMQLSAICKLLGDSKWKNQQYESLSVFESLSSVAFVSNACVSSKAVADSLFEDNTSFYLWDSDNELAYLGFFVTKTGVSITTPYVRKEIEIAIQNMFVTYVSLNESYNTVSARKSLQQGANKIIKTYVNDGMLDSLGANYATIGLSDARFFVSGEIFVTNATALWRASFTAYYGETPTSADGTIIS